MLYISMLYLGNIENIGYNIEKIVFSKKIANPRGIVQLWTSFRTESRGWWGWISLRVESTVVDLVLYRKQGVVWMDLASGGKYSYGPRFVPKAGGGGGGRRFL